MIEKLRTQLEALSPQLQAHLADGQDLSAVEEALDGLLKGLYGDLVQALVQQWLSSPMVQVCAEAVGASRGQRRKEIRPVTVTIRGGVEIELETGYFVKKPSQKKTSSKKTSSKKKRRGRGTGRSCYPALEALGIHERCSLSWLSEVSELAGLCPSMAVACEVLSRRGVKIEVKRLRRLCKVLGQLGMSRRGRQAWTLGEDWRGVTLVIQVDGGRLRERQPKRGRKHRGQRRQGFRGEWREPRQLVIYRLAGEGEKGEALKPVYDATLSDHEGVMWLLTRYLKSVEVEVLSRVVVCGDGAAWIWKDVEGLCAEGHLPAERVVQVLDYTHAKQNLQELIDLLPAKVRGDHQCQEQWKQWLWTGDVEAMRKALCRHLRGKKREQGLKKWAFFRKNAERVRYSAFQAQGLPCGSGTVESAIRRVINLRLKGAGIFWTRETAECFLFLRAQMLSGRWEVFLANLHRERAEPFRACLEAIVPAANDAEKGAEQEVSDAA
jgi:hypothetical protein